ncbi:hypothetical protein GGR57DRAFT_503017 [Xylariaceae sp. FL1272]|nr:hypothetical protein GGR57DRAFT_503017 [Xylariaceae sp. FL1272]
MTSLTVFHFAADVGVDAVVAGCALAATWRGRHAMSIPFRSPSTAIAHSMFVATLAQCAVLVYRRSIFGIPLHDAEPTTLRLLYVAQLAIPIAIAYVWSVMGLVDEIEPILSGPPDGMPGSWSARQPEEQGTGDGS